MSLTAIVATVGRPSLERTVVSIERCLPGAEILLMPSTSSEQDVRRRFPGHSIGLATDDLYGAWNTAVQQVQTTHCIFVNDDDRLDGSPLPRSAYSSPDKGLLVVLPLVRQGRRATQPSLTRLLRRPSPVLADLLRGTRLMINTVIWPISLLHEVGGFSSDYRIRADAEWMQRLGQRRFSFRWVKEPRYVQGRGADRLSSSSGPNRPRLLKEAELLASRILQTSELGYSGAMVTTLWLWNMRRVLRVRNVKG